MTLFSILLPLTILQVGPNPYSPSVIGGPDDLRNRPERPKDASQPAAPSDPSAAWLSQCLTQLETDAARAHAQAQIKRSEAFGSERVVANHCLGLAATKLGLWDDARTAFIAARDETPPDEVRARARFGAMAGNAALGGGDPAQALSLLETARSDAQSSASTPLQVVAAIDAARALVALDRPQEALAQLDAATTLAPEVSEGWLLKATLLRRLDRLGDAQAAIEKAVALSPQEVEIGLEAGVIAILAGREDAARASWQSVIDTQPVSLAAERARDYLEQIGPADQSPSNQPTSDQPPPQEPAS